MNILHINSNYTFTYLHQELVTTLNYLNINNTVYSPISGKIKPVINPKNDKNLFNIKSFNQSERYFYFYKQYKIYRTLHHNFDVKNYDVIHAHTLFTDGYSAYRLFKKYNIPYIITVRNTDINIFFKKNFFLRPLGINILMNASKITFLSESYLATLLKKYIPIDKRKIIESKSKVIPNGINEYWHKNKLTKIKKINSDSISILYVGRINKNKNLISTIKACELLISKGYNISFTVVGDSENKKIYDILESKNFVNLINKIPREKLILKYQKNDIFVMPSIHESFGLVYAEAMSQGLPVIYTKNQGFDKHFEDGVVGYSVDPHDVTMIANRIIDICKEYSVISNNCITLSSIFEWKNIAEEYYDIYQLAIREAK